MIFFSQCRKIALDSEEEPDWVLFGIPYDCTASFHTGARFGPNSIRDASYHLEVFDCELEVDLTRVHTRDLGNINVRYGDPKANCEIIQKACFEVGVEHPFIALGGEHTIAYPLVSVVNPDIFISVDAHLDLRDEYLGEPLSHACTSRRVLDVCDVHIYGYRECSQEEYTFVKENNIPAYQTSQLDSIVYPQGKKVYLSIDVDVLDPSVAPNVSNPVPGGLQVKDVVAVVQNIMENNTVVSMDVCEVCSRYADRTAVTAAFLLYKMLAVWWVTHE